MSSDQSYKYLLELSKRSVLSRIKVIQLRLYSIEITSADIQVLSVHRNLTHLSISSSIPVPIIQAISKAFPQLTYFGCQSASTNPEDLIDKIRYSFPKLSVISMIGEDEIPAASWLTQSNWFLPKLEEVVLDSSAILMLDTIGLPLSICSRIRRLTLAVFSVRLVADAVFWETFPNLEELTFPTHGLPLVGQIPEEHPLRYLRIRPNKGFDVDFLLYWTASLRNIKEIRILQRWELAIYTWGLFSSARNFSEEFPEYRKRIPNLQYGLSETRFIHMREIRSRVWERLTENIDGIQLVDVDGRLFDDYSYLMHWYDREYDYVYMEEHLTDSSNSAWEDEA